MNDYFSSLLSSRGHVFEIDTELKVRKYLEHVTDYKIELQKNNDIYGYDLVVNLYDTDKKDWSKKSIAFIEIEVSETWISEYPKNWMYYSFLARKIYDFDRANKCFTDNLRCDAEKTIYLVFNRDMSDCFCALISETINYCNLHYLNRFDGDVYRDTYLRTKLSNENVVRGKSNCMTFIRSKIDEFSKL